MKRYRGNAALKTSVRLAVFAQGMTYELAAEALGLRPGQVAGIAHRTPHRLRASLTVTSA